MKFSESLKRFRDSLGISQAAIADKLGIKVALYQRYEWGKTSPSVDFIIKTAKTFDVSADYLLGLTDEPRPKPADKVLVEAIVNCRDSIQKVLAEVDRLA